MKSVSRPSTSEAVARRLLAAALFGAAAVLGQHALVQSSAFAQAPAGDREAGRVVAVKTSDQVSTPNVPFHRVSCDALRQSDKAVLRCDVRFDGKVTITGHAAADDAGAVRLTTRFFEARLEDDETAFIFLIDRSDPARRAAVTNAVADAGRIVDGMGARQQAAIYSFDSDVSEHVRFTSDKRRLKDGLAQIRAQGQATELYRHAIEAIRRFAAIPARNKVLVVFSDGKAEDKGFTREEVTAAAREAGVVIVGIGYPDRESDKPSLQTLMRLADETDGRFIAAPAGRSVPAADARAFAAGFVTGGRLEAQVESATLPGVVTVTLLFDKDEKSSFKAAFSDVESPRDARRDPPPGDDVRAEAPRPGEERRDETPPGSTEKPGGGEVMRFGERRAADRPSLVGDNAFGRAIEWVTASNVRLAGVVLLGASLLLGVVLLIFLGRKGKKPMPVHPAPEPFPEPFPNPLLQAAGAPGHAAAAAKPFAPPPPPLPEKPSAPQGFSIPGADEPTAPVSVKPVEPQPLDAPDSIHIPITPILPPEPEAPARPTEFGEPIAVFELHSPTHEVFQITRAHVRIGRQRFKDGALVNDIVLEPQNVSKEHAEIILNRSGHFEIVNRTWDRSIEDGGPNPIFINGQQMDKRAILSDGDTIRFGNVGNTVGVFKKTQGNLARH